MFNKPRRNEWLNARIHIQTYKEIPEWKKRQIIKQGEKDARRALISFDDNAVIHSDFCNELLEKANAKIELIWRQCQSDLHEYKPFLDSEQAKFDDLLSEYRNSVSEKKAIIAEIKATKLPGDSDMSEGTVQARINKRIKEQTVDVQNRIDSYKSQLNSIIENTKAILTDYEARELIAESDEKTIEHGLYEELSIYLQGTWRLIDSRPFDVKTPKLTSRPKERHYSNHPRYCFSISKRNIKDR